MDPPIASSTTTTTTNKPSNTRTLHTKRSFGTKHSMSSHHLHAQPLDSPAYDASEEDNDPLTDSGASAVSVHASSSAHTSNNTSNRTRLSVQRFPAGAVARRHVLASSLVSSDDGVDSPTYDGDVESSTTAGPDTAYTSSRREHYASSASTLSPASPTSPLPPSGSTHAERCEAVRHCRWVDEIVPEAPWVIDESFLEKYKIDYVAHDVDPYGSAGHDDVYAFCKRAGRFLPTRRTPGISTSDLLARLVSGYRLRVFDKKLAKMGMHQLMAEGSDWDESAANSRVGSRAVSRPESPTHVEEKEKEKGAGVGQEG